MKIGILLSVALIPLATTAQTYNYYGDDGVFAGSVQVTPSITYMYGSSMEPKGFITTTTPSRPLPPIVFEQSPIVPIPQDNYNFAPFEPLTLDSPEIGGLPQLD